MAGIADAFGTLICFQTKTAELFLHHTGMTPDALRIRLLAVFTILHQLRIAPEPTSGDHPVDGLAKLADLLDRGLLSEDGFQNPKLIC